MAKKQEKINKETEESAITKELRKLIIEEVQGLTEKDIEEIVTALMPKIEEIVSTKIKEHINMIISFIKQNLKE